MRTTRANSLLLLMIAVTSLVIVSCSGASEMETPEDVFSRDSMVMVMAKIHIAEAVLNQYGSQTSQIDFKAAYLQKLIQKNGIDTTRFNRSFDFYASNPGIFSSVYDDVINEISRQQAEGKGK